MVTASPRIATLQFGYMRRLFLVLASAVAVGAALVVHAPAPLASAQTPIGSVIVEGTGNGHGRGLSQYGAYGWAVDYRWTHSQILNHYYGGTERGLTPSLNDRIRVRLLAVDDVAGLKLIAPAGGITITGVAGTYASVYAVKVANNQFQLWGAPIGVATDCNADTAGFADITPIPVTPTTKVEFSIVGGDGASTPVENVLGVCLPDGSVKHYRGTIEFWDTFAGTRVVNSVLVEQYLRGVLPREVPASWGDKPNGIEALKAQAVAARSYGLSQSRSYWVEGVSGPTRYASTCDSSTCQVYGGAATRTTGSAAAVTRLEDDRTNTAIGATAGEVRRWPGDPTSYVSTEFSSSNGPRTAGGLRSSGSRVFPAVDDPADATSSNRLHRWTRVLDGAVLAARHGLDTLTSVSMADVDNGYDGIWYNNVVLTGSNGKTVRVDAWTFRGQNGLPSPGFTVRGEQRGAVPMTANQTIELQVVGANVSAPNGTVSAIPSGVSAVALNITAVEPSAAGYATVWPCDVARPDASNLNFVAGGVVANGVIAPVGASGTVCFYSNATTHFLVDIAGWFGGGAGGDPAFVGATPARVLDTRNGIGGPKARIQPGGTLTVPMAGASVRRTDGTPITIPGDATAVAVNVTAVEPSQAGFITVWPCGATMPVASNVNFARGGAVANGVVAPLGANGAICVFSDQGADVLVDVLGWFGGGARPAFVGAVPLRLVDTRNGVGGPIGMMTPATPRSVPVRNVTVNVNGVARQVPADASAVALNVTMVTARAAGFATVWPCGTPQPEASNVNFRSGATVANGVVAPIGADGSICVATSADAHLLVDIAGWFAGGADAGFVGNIPLRLVDTRNNIGPIPQ